MKKLLYLFTFLLMVSCSDSEDTPDAVTSDFTGTWNLTSYSTQSTAKVSAQGQSHTISSNSFGKDFDYTITFSENPNEYTSEGTYTIVLEYDAGYGNETDEYTISESEAFSNGTWNIEDNKMIFDNQNNISDIVDFDIDLGLDTNINGITIKSISDNRIVLEEVISQDFSDTYYGEEVSYEIDVKLTIVLEK